MSILAIDAGTTGVRCRAVFIDGQEVVAAYREFTQHFPRPGWVEHDAEEIWHVTARTLVDVIERVGSMPAAIGITNQRETVVAWDRASGRPLARAIVWQDRRTSDFCAQLESDGVLPLVRSTTGLVLDPYFSATKARWIFTEGAVTPDHSVALGTIDSWLVWNLTLGASFVTDHTNAAITGLVEIDGSNWSDHALAALGMIAGSLLSPTPAKSASVA